MFIPIYINEEWKPLIFRSIKPMYEISTMGRVRNIKSGKLLAISYSERDYPMVSLMTDKGTQDTFKLQRIMAHHFLMTPEGDDWTVNHKDGRYKADVRPENLEWLTFTDNIRHSFITGLNQGLKGEDNGSAIHSEQLIHRMCQLMQDGLTNRDIRKVMTNEGIDMKQVNRFTFYDIRHRKRWSHVTQLYEY